MCDVKYEKQFREYEAVIAARYKGVIMSDESELDRLFRINKMYSELNSLLTEKHQSSLLFGSIIYSLSDFRLR